MLMQSLLNTFSSVHCSFEHSLHGPDGLLTGNLYMQVSTTSVEGSGRVGVKWVGLLGALGSSRPEGVQ